MVIMTMRQVRRFTFVKDLANIRKKPVWYTGKSEQNGGTQRRITYDRLITAINFFLLSNLSLFLLGKPVLKLYGRKSGMIYGLKGLSKWKKKKLRHMVSMLQGQKQMKHLLLSISESIKRGSWTHFVHPNSAKYFG